MIGKFFKVAREARYAPSRIRYGIDSSVQFGRSLLIVLFCGLLVACSGGEKPSKSKFSPKKYGVAGSPRVVKLGEPVPKGGGRYVVGKPYTIAGKRYYPKHDPDYAAVGLSSWYGPTFHGRLTANGEVFDMETLTAAHTTMPLPSYARVTNLKNGASVVVRVNDRGPFHGKRIVDVSQKAATLLGFRRNGTAKVKVEYIGRARMDGLDHRQLMATYRAPGASAPGGTLPGTQFAGLVNGPIPIPRARPEYWDGYGNQYAKNRSGSDGAPTAPKYLPTGATTGSAAPDTRYVWSSSFAEKPYISAKRVAVAHALAKASNDKGITLKSLLKSLARKR
ncbi:MAG: septal ring lytic transglycosylase RlpA family protein [Stappiaceae bacterium]